MTGPDVVVLLGVGVLAGVVSTVVSLASVVSYPALLAVGLPPVAANVTNTVALVFSGVGAAAGSRPELVGQAGRVLRLGVVTAVGGAAGAGLLLLLPPQTFEAVAPWLIGGASLLLLAQPNVKRLRGGHGHDRSLALLAALFTVAVYVGYFGAAGGILLLAVLSAMFDQPLARTNAVKNVIAGSANGVAALAFAVFGPVQWAAAAPLAAGFLVGGWLGPALVRRLPGHTLRVLVAACGLLVAVAIAVDTYF